MGMLFFIVMIPVMSISFVVAVLTVVKTYKSSFQQGYLLSGVFSLLGCFLIISAYSKKVLEFLLNTFFYESMAYATFLFVMIGFSIVYFWVLCDKFLVFIADNTKDKIRW